MPQEHETHAKRALFCHPQQVYFCREVRTRSPEQAFSRRKVRRRGLHKEAQAPRKNDTCHRKRSCQLIASYKCNFSHRASFRANCIEVGATIPPLVAIGIALALQFGVVVNATQLRTRVARFLASCVKVRATIAPLIALSVALALLFRVVPSAT